MVKKNTRVKNKETEKTLLKALGLCAFTHGSSPSAVDVKDGRIIRIRPLHYDLKYTKEEIGPWKVERNGNTFKPTMKSAVAP